MQHWLLTPTIPPSPTKPTTFHLPFIRSQKRSQNIRKAAFLSLNSDLNRINLYFIVNMSFLEAIWEKLRQRKAEGKQQPVEPLPSEFQGYRTIPIQNLERKELKYPYTNRSGKEDIARMMDVKGVELTYQENCHLSRFSDKGFFATFYQAYINHGDLKVKPDQIWLTILLWFAKYVEDNAEQLRKAFVSHSGKMKLQICQNSQGHNEKYWNTFITLMKAEILKNTTPGAVEKLQCDFTTTNEFDRLFSSAVIMSGFKKYFEYSNKGGSCGIVKIHMAGTLQDWQHLVDKLRGLEQYDVDGKLKMYISKLEPVLEQFVQTYKGFPHLEFWNNLYEERDDPTIPAYATAHVINGWIIRFFTHNQIVLDKVKAETMKVDILFIDSVSGKETNMLLFGGCCGMSIEKDVVYRPHYSYSIVQKPSERNKIRIREPIKKETIFNINNKKILSQFINSPYIQSLLSKSRPRPIPNTLQVVRKNIIRDDPFRNLGKKEEKKEKLEKIDKAQPKKESRSQPRKLLVPLKLPSKL